MIIKKKNNRQGHRYLGIDDAPFKNRRGSRVLLIGAVCRGTELDGVISTHVTKDGWNASAKIAEMITRSKFHRQIRAVLLDGIAVGGLNVVDLPFLHEQTGLPVITVMRKEPDPAGMERACRKLPRSAKRIALIKRGGGISRSGAIFFQGFGLPYEEIRAILKELSVCGHIPEPVRLAHLIAGGVISGESGKRA